MHSWARGFQPFGRPLGDRNCVAAIFFLQEVIRCTCSPVSKESLGYAGYADKVDGEMGVFPPLGMTRCARKVVRTMVARRRGKLTSRHHGLASARARVKLQAG